MWVSTIITTIVGSFTCGLLGCSVRILVGLVDRYISFFFIEVLLNLYFLSARVHL